MKRIAISLDGTWNTLNNNTNVWRLKSLTTQSADQYVYYSQGVGTRRGESARGGITGYGIDEEIIFRWGLLSAVLVLMRKLGARDGFWIANIVVTLLFGAGHLPATAALAGPLTAPTVAYVLLGNVPPGLLFGWLFRRRGLESAMLAHGAADVWLHAALPALLA